MRSPRSARKRRRAPGGWSTGRSRCEDHVHVHERGRSRLPTASQVDEGGGGGGGGGTSDGGGGGGVPSSGGGGGEWAPPRGLVFPKIAPTPNVKYTSPGLLALLVDSPVAAAVA